MNLWFRLLYQLLHAPWRTRLQILQPSSLTMRCWPSDLDLNMHMTNGRYLMLMDLGRLDLVTRVGLLKIMWRRRWRPVLGAAQIRFYKPIAPGQSFRLESRVLGWEGKWFYIQQRFYLGEVLASDALTKALFVGPHGSVMVEDTLQALGYTQPSPSLEGVARL